SSKNNHQERIMGCYQSIVINQPIDKVWDTIKDFHDLSWAVGVVEQVEVVGDKSGSEVGAGRILNGVFHETLLEVDDEECVFVYSIDNGPEMLADAKGYRGAVQLSPITQGSGTFVEWSSSWRNDVDGVAEFCDPIYQALLNAMAKHLA
ncbi:MAG: SRPBCC family protein, partial [Emcibacteraceae bacterium]|nr:SRPBCC family protein [Emcibacteraceae bacterium]